MRQAQILRFLSIFSSLFDLIMQIITYRLNGIVTRRPYSSLNKYSILILSICICLSACKEEVKEDSNFKPPSDAFITLPNLKSGKSLDQTVDQASDLKSVVVSEGESVSNLKDQGSKLDQSSSSKINSLKKSDQVQQLSDSEDNTQKQKSEHSETQIKKKKPKKPSRCKRGIHKGRKKCLIERGHISLYHINRGKRHKSLKLIDDQRRVIPEAREIMLEFLSDWRSKKRCKKGFSFNYEYKGRASWRMYDCYVQDRLLWYLYLIGHHFDSEIQIVSGLRAHERKTSRHHNGHAVDFRVKGVQAKKVWEYSKKTFPLVGIGYYPKTKFVHLDVGRDHHQAYWVDGSGSGESASYKAGVSQVQRGRARKSQAGMISSIKRSLKRHYKSFKAKQKVYLERKKRREARAKKRRQRRKRRRKSKK